MKMYGMSIEELQSFKGAENKRKRKNLRNDFNLERDFHFDLLALKIIVYVVILIAVIMVIYFAFEVIPTCRLCK